MPRKKPLEPQRQVSFRLPASMVRRLESHAEHLTRTMGGVVFARVDALKVLLTGALDRAEAERGATPVAPWESTPATGPVPAPVATTTTELEPEAPSAAAAPAPARPMVRKPRAPRRCAIPGCNRKQPINPGHKHMLCRYHWQHLHSQEEVERVIAEREAARTAKKKKR